MLFTVWVVIHVLVSIALVLVVLLQSSKGEGLAGSAFGGGGGMAGAVFGGRGAAGFLSKATTVLAILFMFNCGVLAYMSAGSSGRLGSAGDTQVESVVTRQAQEEMDRRMQQQQQVPVTSDTVNPEGLLPAEQPATADTGSGQ